ncbi:LEA_2 domain-containing protein [Cephalotus follicularis]|uniref:LEA_2 domain-containing protein n=1 Tax=Cephalotus follicularis TaxID=3775 RepID=A0A1Q3D9W5_CEPFO|nr:LEA_2 domain-containing protein [Cephalotus follicularis]
MVTSPQPRAPPPRHHVLRYVAIALLALIVIVGIAVLIAWLIVKPKRFVYTIEDGSVNNFKLANNHLNSTIDFILWAENPNRRISVYYDSIHVSVVYEDQTIGFNMVEPFHQPHQNVTRLGVTVVAQNLALSKSSYKDLWIDKSSRRLELDVHVKAKIRFKVGLLQTKHRTLRLLCSPVIATFSSKSSEITKCDIDV